MSKYMLFSVILVFCLQLGFSRQNKLFFDATLLQLFPKVEEEFRKVDVVLR